MPPRSASPVLRHRSFLADFYEGVFPGSFARGALFQSNPLTGDKRSSGATASFCGLDKSLAENDHAGIETANQAAS